MSSSIVVRRGCATDAPVVLSLWDGAIAWLVERGQVRQWGTKPASADARNREMVRQRAGGSGLRLAELDGVAVGASVIVRTPPAYVPPSGRRETYLLFLVSNRTCAGRGIGSALVRQAVADARATNSEVLRVDCWPEATDLLAWYERQGFVRSDTFTVGDGWRGQVFEMYLNQVRDRIELLGS